MQNQVPQDLVKYSEEFAYVIAVTMCQMNEGIVFEEKQVGHQFVQTYSLAKGIKKFGERGHEAAVSKVKQIHDCVVFRPISVEELTKLKRKRAMESLIFLNEKRDGRIKGHACANGSTQREYVDPDDAASPTASMESIIITGVLDAFEGHDVMTADIPNAFVQTEVGEQKKDEQIIMKL